MSKISYLFFDALLSGFNTIEINLLFSALSKNTYEDLKEFGIKSPGYLERKIEYISDFCGKIDILTNKNRCHIVCCNILHITQVSQICCA